MTYFSTFRPYLLGLLLVLGLGNTALAQAPKVGFVNIPRLFEEARPAKDSSHLLEKEFATRDQELLALRNSLKNAIDLLNQDAPTLTTEQLAQRQNEVAQLDQVFQQKRNAAEESLNTRKNEELLKLQTIVNTAIRQVAEKGNYAYVLTEAAYIAPGLDITNEVLQSINSLATESAPTGATQ